MLTLIIDDNAGYQCFQCDSDIEDCSIDKLGRVIDCGGRGAGCSISYGWVYFIDFGVAQQFKRGCRDIQFPIECGKTIVRYVKCYFSVDFLSGFRNLSVLWRSL